MLSWDARDAPAYARVFATDLAWGEDPATGSAALGTGVWLVATGLVAPEGTASYPVRQGERLGRPSVLDCTVTAAAAGGDLRRPCAAPSSRWPPGASGSVLSHRVRVGGHPAGRSGPRA